MIKRSALVLASILLALPALAIEPEQRQVIVTHNRVWDGFAYKENFVPSDADQMLLLADSDNAVSFVQTWEYYWPLSRQKFVAFEKQHDAVNGTLVVRRNGDVVAEIVPERYANVYPEGALKGDGRLAWGVAADAAFAKFVEEERAFVREFAAAQQVQAAYEAALRDAAIARLNGQGVQPVTPPKPPPQPLLKLVTEPDTAFRINLPVGDYQIELVRDGQPVAGTGKSLSVIAAGARDVLTADIVPEERWTRPLQANAEADRIYVRPGAVFFVTLNHASRFGERDYLCLTRPQSCAPEEGEVWVRRQPAPEVAGLEIAWSGQEAPDALGLMALKVEQTRGASFGYVVRQARSEETADLSAFVVQAPTDSGIHTAMLSSSGDAVGSFVRQVVVVQPRSELLAWSLALLPAVFGTVLTWRRWRRSD
jgi:hypothetical protein